MIYPTVWRVLFSSCSQLCGLHPSDETVLDGVLILITPCPNGLVPGRGLLKKQKAEAKHWATRETLKSLPSEQVQDDVLEANEGCPVPPNEPVAWQASLARPTLR